MGDHTFGNFSKGDNGGLVRLLLNKGLLAGGGELSRAFGGEHDQVEAVIDEIQAIFYGYTCHG